MELIETPKNFKTWFEEFEIDMQNITFEQSSFIKPKQKEVVSIKFTEIDFGKEF